MADAPGCSQSLAGLLSVPLTLLGPPAINNNAYAKGVHLAMALAADRRQANLWHLRPTGQETSLHGGGTRGYGGTRGDAAGSKGAVCGAMHAARCGTLPKSALRSAMSILAAVLALDDRALPPGPWRCSRVVATVDLGVGYRLQTANERVMVRTGEAGHVSSARSSALVCSSARPERRAVTVWHRWVRCAERGRVGSKRSCERACADLSMEKQRAPSTGCCTGWAANTVEARAAIRSSPSSTGLYPGILRRVSECHHHGEAWQAAGERVRRGRAARSAGGAGSSALPEFAFKTNCPALERFRPRAAQK